MQFTHPRLVRCLVVAAILTAVPFAQSQTFSSGSTGADGPLNLTTPGTIIFDPAALGLHPVVDNVFNFTTINVAAGVTVSFTSQRLSGPVYWLAQGAVTIGGQLNLDGEPGHESTEFVSNRNICLWVRRVWRWCWRRGRAGRATGQWTRRRCRCSDLRAGGVRRQRYVYR
jgi:hypothetical protein